MTYSDGFRASCYRESLRRAYADLGGPAWPGQAGVRRSRAVLRVQSRQKRPVQEPKTASFPTKGRKIWVLLRLDVIAGRFGAFRCQDAWVSSRIVAKIFPTKRNDHISKCGCSVTSGSASASRRAWSRVISRETRRAPAPRRTCRQGPPQSRTGTPRRCRSRTVPTRRGSSRPRPGRTRRRPRRSAAPTWP